MTEKSAKPQLTFAGFDDTGEQRKFGEMFSERRDKTTVENENTLLSCAINGMYLNSELFGHFRGSTTIGYIKVKKNDLILSAQNLHLGNANVNLRFESGIISPAYKVYDLIEFDPYFVQAGVKKDTTKDFFLSCTTEGASVCRKNIDWNELNHKTVAVPNYEEQKKLGKYFSQLDHLITLHQRKYDKLTNVKKSMLEKMFPKNGSNVPEIRFKGFSDAWEQRKLNEVVNVYDGVHQTPDYKDSGVMFLSVENISTLKSEKYISEEAFQRDYKVYPQKGDILMTRIGDVGTPNVVETTEKVAFYVSLALLKPTKINSYFLCNSIQSPLFQKGLKDRTLVTAIPQKINKDEIGKVNIILPTSSQEQQLIGEYFRNLDNLITLHQRELEKLKNLKKACLEKMFV